MTKLELDKESYLIFPLFLLGSAVSLGLLSTDILGFIDLGETLLTTGDIEWTIGRGISVAALGTVFINRDAPLDFDNWGLVETWTVYVTIALVIAPPIFPALAETLVADEWAFVSLTVQSIGFGLVTYIN